MFFQQHFVNNTNRFRLGEEVKERKGRKVEGVTGSPEGKALGKTLARKVERTPDSSHKQGSKRLVYVGLLLFSRERAVSTKERVAQPR